MSVNRDITLESIWVVSPNCIQRRDWRRCPQLTTLRVISDLYRSTNLDADLACRFSEGGHQQRISHTQRSDSAVLAQLYYGLSVRLFHRKMEILLTYVDRLFRYPDNKQRNRGVPSSSPTATSDRWGRDPENRYQQRRGSRSEQQVRDPRAQPELLHPASKNPRPGTAPSVARQPFPYARERKAHTASRRIRDESRLYGMFQR